jgi:hypothetical protein
MKVATFFSAGVSGAAAGCSTDGSSDVAGPSEALLPQAANTKLAIMTSESRTNKFRFIFFSSKRMLELIRFITF